MARAKSKFGERKKPRATPKVESTDYSKQFGRSAPLHVRPNSLVAELDPPSLIRGALRRLAQRHGVKTVAQLAMVSDADLRALYRVGIAKMAHLWDLRRRARVVCGLEGLVGWRYEEGQEGSQCGDPKSSTDDGRRDDTLATKALENHLPRANERREGTEQPPSVEEYIEQYVGLRYESGRALAPPSLSAELSATTAGHLREEALDQLLYFAARVAGCRTIGELTTVELAQACAWLEFGQNVLSQEVEDVLAAAHSALDPELILERALSSLSLRERIIAERMTFARSDESSTLQLIGDEFGVSRERVRQIKLQLENMLSATLVRELRPVTNWIRTIYGPVVTRKRGLHLLRVFRMGANERGERVARAVWWAAGYEQQGDWLVSADVKERASEGAQRLKQLARDACYFDAAELSGELDQMVWDADDQRLFAKDWASLSEFEGGWIPNDSDRARTAAAIRVIGRPASKEEVAKLTGLSPERVGSYLSSLPDVLRKDLHNWGLQEWIDRPYQGIVAAIRSEVEADGGQVLLSDLVRRVAERFGASEASVASYAQSALDFQCTSGVVSLATNRDIEQFAPESPHDSPHAVAMADGQWGARVKVEARYFDGYSAGIPWSVAYAQGLRPRDSLVVPVEGTKHAVTLIWRTTQITRLVDLGRISALLVEKGIDPGDELIVVPSRTAVRIYRAADAPVAVDREDQLEATQANYDDLMADLFRRSR